MRHLPGERRLLPSSFVVLSHATDRKQGYGFIARERQVEKYNGFWPIWLAKREIFQPVAREVRFGVRREPLLAQLGGFLRYEAAKHLGKWHKGAGAACRFARKRHAGVGTRTVAARIAPRPSPAPIAPGAEMGPCRRNGAVRFITSGLCTND